jgi:hypothetical protein
MNKKHLLWIIPVYVMLLATMWFVHKAAVRPFLDPRIKPYQTALQNLKDLGAAEAEYNHRSGRYGALQELAETGLIPLNWASGRSAFYQFEIQLNGAEFEAFATPIKYGPDLHESFYLSSKNWKIRGADKAGKPADVNDPVIE